jgi:hypothetical protein
MLSGKTRWYICRVRGIRPRALCPPNSNQMNALLQVITASGMGICHRVVFPRTHIAIAFYPNAPIEIEIQQTMNSILLEDHRSHSSSDDHFWPAPTLKTARFPNVSRPPTCMSHAHIGRNNRPIGHEPEKDLFDASMRALDHCKSVDNSMPAMRMVDFSVELPDAEFVQLAADFTDWEEAPLSMIRFDDGIWSLTVPLPPGIYAYRFIADGDWYDDPRVTRRNPESAESGRAYVKVR